MKSFLKLLVLWTKTDIKINKTYTSHIIYTSFQFIITLGLFYFISKTVGIVESLGTSYFTFVVSGLSLQSLITGFSRGSTQKLGQWRDYGMLEGLLWDYYRPLTFLISAGASQYILAILRTTIYIIILCYFAEIKINPSALMACFFLTLSFGLLLSMVSSCSFLIWKKFGLLDIVGKISTLFLSGTYFPVEVLPQSLQWLAFLNPVNHLLKLYRYSLFSDSHFMNNNFVNSFVVICVSLLVIFVFNLFFLRFTITQLKKNGLTNHF